MEDKVNYKLPIKWNKQGKAQSEQTHLPLSEPAAHSTKGWEFKTKVQTTPSISMSWVSPFRHNSGSWTSQVNYRRYYEYIALARQCSEGHYGRSTRGQHGEAWASMMAMTRGAMSEKTSLTWKKTNSTEAPNQSSLELGNHSFISQIVYLIVAEHPSCRTDNIEVKTKAKKAQYITKSTDSIWNA